MPIIKIQEVTVETVQKGKNKYQIANVVCTDNGKNKTQKIFSFANPAVFDVVKDAKAGEEYDVKLTKDDKGYWNWASLAPAGDAPKEAPKAAGGKVVGSNYETPEERKLRQLLIVKQSSIANALEFVKMSQADGITIKGVLDVAQEFVDYVYGTNETLEEMDSDIPY